MLVLWFSLTLRTAIQRDGLNPSYANCCNCAGAAEKSAEVLTCSEIVKGTNRRGCRGSTKGATAAM